MHGLKKLNRKTAGFAAAVFIIFAAAFINLSSSLPSRVFFFEGELEEFNFNVPLSAEFFAESESVLSVNSSPVSGNINLSLNEPFCVEPKNIGEMEVKLSLFGLIPVKTVSVSVIPQTSVIPCGRIVGITLKTDGILVLGTGAVYDYSGDKTEPAKDGLKTGDVILQAGEKMLETKEDLIETISESGGSAMVFKILRGDSIKTVTLTPVKSKENGSYKIGAWVRDGTKGIGTLTYTDPSNGEFGALGHGVYDVDTGGIMPVKSGYLVEAVVTGIKKGTEGTPGEISGILERSSDYGYIEKNSDCGLFGMLKSEGKTEFDYAPVPISLKQDAEIGQAVIRSDIAGNGIEEYEIQIESINRSGRSADKSMVIKITDEKLLELTGGIIQGMSGSPILQNGRIIGAVTHVFVQNPTKGYGIFIENMLEKRN